MDGEPDTLAGPGDGLTVLVGIGSIVVGRLDEGRASFVPGALSVSDE